MDRRQVITVGTVLAAVLVATGCSSATGATGGGSDAVPSTRTPPTGDLASSPAADARAVPLSESAFWQLVEASRQGSGGDADAQADRLSSLLRGQRPEQLVAFQYRLVAASRRLYSWRLAAAGDLVCGSLGDDGFTDFRSWVISRGRDAYSRALADPDSLAPLVTQLECPGAELFGAAVLDAYQRKTGRDMWDVVPDLPVLEPGGEAPAGDGRISPDDAAAMFPRLAAAGAGDVGT